MTLRKMAKAIVLIVAVIAIAFVLETCTVFMTAHAMPADDTEQDQGITAFGQLWTEDEYVLAQVVFREAGNQDCIGQLAVAQVVINRMASEHRGEGTIRGVIMDRHQFTPTDNQRWFLRTRPTIKELIHARLALSDYQRELNGEPRLMPKVVDDGVLYFNGGGGKNHFYEFYGRKRVYVHVDEGVCAYCDALKTLSDLKIN